MSAIMKNFRPGAPGGFKRKEGGFGGKSSFKGGKGGARFGNNFGSDEQKELFRATCAKCARSCEVPFRPNGEKPVFCRDCFRRDDDRRDPRGGRDQSRDSRPPREFKSPQNEYTGGKKDAGLEEVTRQLAALETKLNRILDIINPPQPKVAVSTPVQEEAVTKKVRAKKEAGTVKKKVAKKTK